MPSVTLLTFATSVKISWISYAVHFHMKKKRHFHMKKKQHKKLPKTTI